MRKGSRAALITVALALTACSAAATTPAAAPSAAWSEPVIARAALQARQRAIIPATTTQWTVAPVAANDAAALTQQLVTAERAIRDPEVTGDELAYMGHLQQLVYRQLIVRPELRAAVFDAVPADLRAAADFNFAASADLWLFGPVYSTALPAWKIVAPAPLEELFAYYKESEARFGVPWYYLAAINLVETRMGRIRGESYAGAQGPMQFMPATWDAYGDGADINDVHDAIIGAGRYLRAAGAPTKMAKAIWAYNHDQEYVDAVTKYAEVMRADPSAYRGYYGWQVYFINASGVHLLPVGYPSR